MTNDDEAAFLKAIRATPDDDTVRLVYADWLQEHDQEARAEYIRQEVANPKELVREVGGPFFYRRGFAEAIECDANLWVAVADTILDQPYVCLREVRLTTMPVMDVVRACRQRVWRRDPRLGQHVLSSWVTEWPGISFILPPEPPRPLDEFAAYVEEMRADILQAFALPG